MGVCLGCNVARLFRPGIGGDELAWCNFKSYKAKGLELILEFILCKGELGPVLGLAEFYFLRIIFASLLMLSLKNLAREAFSGDKAGLN